MTPILGDAFAHHVWATERVIDACTTLTREQLETPAPGTYGSIIDTLRHLVAADSWYLSFFEGGIAVLEEEAETSLDQLRSVMSSCGTMWMDVLARELDADADLVEFGDGWEFHAPTGIRLAQVVHHGTDHRSQVCTALSSLGITPPDIDVWAFAESTGRSRGVTAPTP